MKPGLPQGTRDFSAEVVRKRNHILHTIKQVFELYGFEPLETPAMENLETLLGKYGDEGDKLIFKILNNGLHDPKNIEKAKAAFEQVLTGKNDKNLTERALRYDLTIPFARYVAMNHGQLTFPYKRYQAQPVWRADRPQKGRYREFFQCDADVVGSRSLQNEADFCLIYHTVFTTLGIKEYTLHINNRKVLAALAQACGGIEHLTTITVAIDKLDKIGLEKVCIELESNGLSTPQIDVIKAYLNISGTNEEIIFALQSLIGQYPMGAAGVEELTQLFSLIKNEPLRIKIDPTLARGLNYYTGIIFEAKAPQQVIIGSIGGGGRYDDLTGLFGVKDVPGIGISFGIDRIYDVMDELSLFPVTVKSGTRFLFFNMGKSEATVARSMMQELRSRNIACEFYHEEAKMDKQFKYAERKNIPHIVIIGDKELTDGTCVVKELATGKQLTLLQKNFVDETI